MNDQIEEKGDAAAVGKALRSCEPDVSASPGCKDRVLARLMAHLEAQQKSRPAKAARRRHATLFLTIGSTVAAVAAACLVLWLTLGGGVPAARADFAKVLRNIREAASVSYDFVARVPGQPEERAHVLVMGDRARITFAGGEAQVFDGIRQKVLALDPASGQARLGNAFAGSAYGSFFQDLRKASTSAGTPAGKTFLDGRQVDVYLVSMPEGTMRMLVDPAEDLPVSVEMASPSAEAGTATMVFDNFRWHVPVDESLLSLEVPPGYTLKRLDAPPTQQDLVHLLKVCADASAGIFPAKLDFPTVSEIVLGRPEREVTASTDGNSKLSFGFGLDAKDKDALRECLGGLTFIEGFRQAGTWQYVGQGARYGDGNAEICWWTSPGSTARRVVYGDLKIKDVPAAGKSSQTKP
jgi:hypothetical protein